MQITDKDRNTYIKQNSKKAQVIGKIFIVMN